MHLSINLNFTISWIIIINEEPFFGRAETYLLSVIWSIDCITPMLQIVQSHTCFMSVLSCKNSNFIYPCCPCYNSIFIFMSIITDKIPKTSTKHIWNFILLSRPSDLFDLLLITNIEKLNLRFRGITAD